MTPTEVIHSSYRFTTPATVQEKNVKKIDPVKNGYAPYLSFASTARPCNKIGTTV